MKSAKTLTSIAQFLVTDCYMQKTWLELSSNALATKTKTGTTKKKRNFSLLRYTVRAQGVIGYKNTLPRFEYTKNIHL